MEFDVVIVGASSSGLFCAERLAEAGLRVAVFERNTKLKPARRTHIVTPEMRRVAGELSEDVVLHKTSIMAVEARGVERRVQLEEPDLIVERSATSQWLLEGARNAGAIIHLGTQFKAIQPNPSGLSVDFEDQTGQFMSIETQTLIGADGIFSAVGRATGLPHPPVQPIVQAEIELPAGWDPEVTKVWFQTDRTPFFFWLIPESETRGVIGLVGDDEASTLEALKGFMHEMGITPLQYQGARVAMHHPRLKPWAKMGVGRIFLIGDAAGQVKVTTVGGTVTGFSGAAAAARAVIEGIPYSVALRPLKRELDLQWGIRLLLHQLDDRGYEQLIRALNPGVRDFLARHNRDCMSPVFWRLVFHPGLVLVGIKALLRLLWNRLRFQTTLPSPSYAEKGTSSGGD